MDGVQVIDASGGIPESQRRTFTWWLYPKDQLHESLTATVLHIDSRSKSQRQENIKNYRSYHTSQTVELYANIYSVQSPRTPLNLTMNVIKSCIDTLSAKLAKQRPRVLFLTEGGQDKTQKKAKKLTKFMDGVFDDIGHYEVKQETFRDMCISGTGITKFYIDWDNKVVKSERVFPDEILVDEMDGMYGKPTNVYQRRFVNRDVLKAHFPDFAEEIETAEGPGAQIVRGYGPTGDLVRVIEAWHRPTKKDGSDGLHVIALNNKCLLYEKWPHDWLPFTFEKYTKPSLGFWATGIVHEIRPIQTEINDVLQRIQESLRLVSVPRVFVESSAKINKAALNSDIGTIIEYQGSPPTFYTPQAMTPEVYNYLASLWAKAYEIVGMSQLSATSQKPAGLDAAVAFREYQDIESERFHLIGQNREQSFLKDAKIIIKLYEMIAAEDPKFSVKVFDGNSYEQLKFKDLDLSLDKYILRTYPSSLFPTQPAAKLSTIMEYVGLGFFDKETAMDLLDFPDLQSAISLDISPRKVVLGQLDKMVDTGEYSPPEPLMDLPMTARLAQLYYLRSKTMGIDEDKLELIRRYISQCQALMGVAQDAARKLAEAEMIIAQQMQQASQPSQDEMAMMQQIQQAANQQIT
jgi:hypothetical protein